MSRQTIGRPRLFCLNPPGICCVDQVWASAWRMARVGAENSDLLKHGSAPLLKRCLRETCFGTVILVLSHGVTTDGADLAWLGHVERPIDDSSSGRGGRHGPKWLPAWPAVIMTAWRTSEARCSGMRRL